MEEFKSDDDEWSDKMARLSEQSGESGPGEMQSKWTKAETQFYHWGQCFIGNSECQEPEIIKSEDGRECHPIMNDPWSTVIPSIAKEQSFRYY